jgi:hypothetical protein
MKSQILTVIFVLLSAGSLSAQPSIYFKWQHNTTKAVVCEPDAPSKDWVRIGGPYQDPDCKYPEPK